EEPKNERPFHLTEPSAVNIKQSQFPLVIVGELSPQECSAVREALVKWNYPIITESLSQLANDTSLEHLRIDPHSRLWNEAHSAQYPIDGVIRIGGVPTLRFWRDLEVHPEASRIPVLSIHSLPLSGLPRAELKVISLESILNLAPPAGPFQSQETAICWKKQNLKSLAKKSTLVEKYLASEPGIFRTLSREIASDALVYLGNSLPIREWDLASEPHSKFENRRITANRGLNGIDGQLSTFFGMVSERRSECWAILGDLTTLYDLNAPWLKPSSNWHVAIINNQGGRIFDRIFGKSEYSNSHHLNFEGWANQWGLSYQRVQGAELQACFKEFRTQGRIPQILELLPDLDSTAQFWAEFERS
ncbi:hypothetical protein EBZ37_11690, partial [bacterium]|nr:hypothetical protein [bacterium]